MRIPWGACANVIIQARVRGAHVPPGLHLIVTVNLTKVLVVIHRDFSGEVSSKKYNIVHALKINSAVYWESTEIAVSTAVWRSALPLEWAVMVSFNYLLLYIFYIIYDNGWIVIFMWFYFSNKNLYTLFIAIQKLLEFFFSIAFEGSRNWGCQVIDHLRNFFVHHGASWLCVCVCRNWRKWLIRESTLTVHTRVISTLKQR